MVYLTQRDIEILSFAFQCLKDPIKVDFDKLASAAGYKSAASACNSFNSVKKKLQAMGADTGKGGPSTPKEKGKARPDEEAGGNANEAADDAHDDYEAKSANPKKRGRKPKATIDADGNVVADTQPAPKKRATKGKVINSEEAGSHDGDDAVVMPKPTKRGRKANKVKDDTPPPTGGPKFYSDNESASDVDAATIVSKFHDDAPVTIKQEDDADDGSRTPAGPLTSNDLEATRACNAEGIADEASTVEHPESDNGGLRST